MIDQSGLHSGKNHLNKSHPNAMRPIRFGECGLKLSPLGLGTVKFGRNTGVKYPQAFELPSDAEISSLMALAQELGINLLDTAPAYGNSESRLGKLLGNTRHNWIICSKAGEYFDPDTAQSSYDFSATAIRHSLEQTLKRLNTDYLDILLIHSNGDDEKIIRELGALEVLADLKREGLIRATGMSTKTVAGGCLALEQADICMCTFNLSCQDEEPVIRYAAKLDKGILIKKVFDSGHLAVGNMDPANVPEQSSNPIQKTFNALFSLPGAISVISGTLNHQHLADNVAALEKSLQSRTNQTFSQETT